MDSGVPDSLHFSLPNAMMELTDMPRVQLAEPNEQQTKWSLFLGITIWFLHLNVLNALVSVSCKWGGLTFPVGGLSGLQFVEGIISLITILAMLFLIYLAWRQWRSFQTQKPTTNPDLLYETEEYRRPLMAFIAMLLNSFLALYIMATLVPMFFLKACGQA